MNIEGKKILITGAAKRVGRVLAEQLAAQGALLIIHYHTSEDEARELCRMLTERGSVAYPIRADLCSEVACEELVREAVRLLGGLDVLVNNAAVFLADDLMTLDMERAAYQMKVNVLAPLLLSRCFALSASAGRIINILDQRMAGHGGEKTLSYTLSKKMLGEGTRILALELAPRFRVNAVSPGAVLAPDDGNRTCVREKAGAAPLGRPGSPEEVAEAVCYLIRSDSTTGQILFVDGGQHLL